ncbi:RNA-binding domain-containing protein [Hypoxylon sp. FL1284]|nr:RNA-binding domain-containing protein [Hypoxylon sp. FL1284]
MQSIRRAAARAACSSATVAVPRQRVASLAMQISKASLRPAVMLPLVRYFSQTMRVAEEEKEEFDTVFNPRSGPAGDESTTELFISNISFDVTEKHLQEAFGKYGELNSIRIGRDGRGLSRGFAFLNFLKPEMAERAVEESNQSFWHGRRILVTFKKSREQGQSATKSPEGPTNSLYIGNIPYETSDADLNQLFRELENLADVRVAVDRNTGWPRGFAHADFTDVESATAALEYLKTKKLGGRMLRLDYAAGRRTNNSAKEE